jgi:hypothetical protein
MSILSWNCKGMGQSSTIHDLLRLVRQYCPKIVFLSKTRQQKNRVSNIRFRMGLNKSFVVDGHGKGGGLAMYWDASINISILSYVQHYIDSLIWNADHHAHWRCTFVYGESRSQDRVHMWELLKRIKPMSAAPWALVGDFNEAMWSFEQFFSRKRSEKQMADFRHTLSHCEVHDLGFIGVPWTFDNKQQGGRNVKVILDNGVASEAGPAGSRLLVCTT